jgi:hypothetical protein
MGLVVRMFHKLISSSWQPRRAAVAGFAATVAYSVAMEGDMSISGNRFSDVRFIEGLLPHVPKKVALPLAWVIHLLNGVALAELYGAVFKRLLPGPNWLKGAIFGELFVVSVWPLTPLADRYHPMIKDGELPKLANWTSFFQNIARHLVFGLALGLLYHEKK